MQFLLVKFSFTNSWVLKNARQKNFYGSLFFWVIRKNLVWHMPWLTWAVKVNYASKHYNHHIWQIELRMDKKNNFPEKFLRKKSSGLKLSRFLWRGHWMELRTKSPRVSLKGKNREMGFWVFLMPLRPLKGFGRAGTCEILLKEAGRAWV